MATLLTMAQGVARDLGELPPSSIFNNSDKFAQQLLRAASKASRRIFKEANWSILIRENTFNTANGTAEYALPADFDSFIDETAWNRTTFWQMRGPLSPRDWQVVKSGLAVSPALRQRWRVKRAAASVADKFVIDPTPTAVEAMVFEYLSNSWATAANGSTLRTDWVADDDIPLLDPDLIELDMLWRMLPKGSPDFAVAKKEADDMISQAVALDGGMPILALAQRGPRLPYPNLPDGGYGT